jgi:hypothetical protein
MLAWRTLFISTVVPAKESKKKEQDDLLEKGGRNVVDIGRGLFESPSVATVDSLVTAESVTVTTQPQGFQNSAAPLWQNLKKIK